MTSSQPPGISEYLARNGFTPNPGNPTWLDRETAQRILRVLHEPGDVTLLYSSHDTEHNNAVVLRDYLNERLEQR